MAKTTIGIKKLKEAMQEHGYAKVAEKCGCGQAILFQYCNGKSDPLGMRMKTAIPMFKFFGIDFLDWTIEANE